MERLLVNIAIFAGTLTLLSTIVATQFPDEIMTAFAYAGAYISFADRFLPVHELTTLLAPIILFLGAKVAFDYVHLVTKIFGAK